MRTGLTPLTPTRLPMQGRGVSPFGQLQSEVNRLFEDMFREVGVPGAPTDALALGTPKIDVSEDDKAVHVSAELPGLREDEIEVTYADHALRIAGETKRERNEGTAQGEAQGENGEQREKSDNGRRYLVRERAYGRVERVLPIGVDVDEDRIEASFKDGVLQVTLPKSAEGESTRRIQVKAG